MHNRYTARKAFADAIVDTSSDELWKYGISRIAEITNFDVIGIPVWTGCRPLSKTVSLHAGKSLDSNLSKAGAIMESIEFEISQTPCIDHEYVSYKEAECGYFLDWRECNLARNSILNDSMLLEWDWCEDISNGEAWAVPSAMIWMSPREKQYFNHFQVSSNGVASGISVTDATISALYEVIERDAWTVDAFKCENGAKPRVIKYECDVLDKIRMAGLMPIIFDCTSDIGIPSYGATILEPGASGSYAGHGCHRDASIAIERALLESVQSRCVYIAGARDDLMRRNFITMKGISQDGLKDMYNSLPSTDVQTDTVNTSDEIKYILTKLQQKGFSKVFRKVLYEGTINGCNFAVVRVFVPGLEVPQFDSWYPSKRCYGRTGN